MTKEFILYLEIKGETCEHITMGREGRGDMLESSKIITLCFSFNCYRGI